MKKLIMKRCALVLCAAMALVLLGSGCDALNKLRPVRKKRRIVYRQKKAPERVAKPAEKGPATIPATERLPAGRGDSLPWLRADGHRIVDEDGRPVLLKGCNLGNWLLLEMWMLDATQLQDQYELEQIFTQRFGEQGKDQLMELYRENWVRERDFKRIKSMQFNVVRLPVNYRLLEDDRHPMQLKPDAFKWIDRAIEMARDQGLYLILDLHGVQGGQSDDHTTGQRDRNRLWTDVASQERLVWLWGELAKRYKDEPLIAAYDVINEPFGVGKNNPVLEAKLVEIFDRVYHAIREHDQRHIIFASGSQIGVLFYGTPEEHGWEQVGFTEHFYPGLFSSEPSRYTHAHFIARDLPWRAAYFEEIKAPFLVGEFNVVFRDLGGARLMRRYYDLYGGYGWAATMWCYKLVKKKGGLGPDTWCIVKNRDAMPSVSFKRSSRKDIENLFRWFGSMPYSFHQNLAAALTMKEPPELDYYEVPKLPLTPPARDEVPGWKNVSINDALPGGLRYVSREDLDVFGSGSDIWKAEDQFEFVCRRMLGDFTCTVLLTNLVESHEYAKAGLMIRSSLQPDAALLMINMFPDGKVGLAWREAPGAELNEKRVAQVIFPVWLKLRKRGQFVDLSYSRDGKDWKKQRIKMSKAFKPHYYFGLFALSHEKHYLTEANFRNLRLTRP